MLVEICVFNYLLYDGIVNSADGLFKYISLFYDKNDIWIGNFNKNMSHDLPQKIIFIY